MVGAKAADEDVGTLQYKKYRDQIDDGDVLCFSGRHWLSSFIRKLSHGSYSHAGLAFWWGDRLMVLQAEATPGVQAQWGWSMFYTPAGAAPWTEARPGPAAWRS